MKIATWWNFFFVFDTIQFYLSKNDPPDRRHKRRVKATKKITDYIAAPKKSLAL